MLRDDVSAAVYELAGELEQRTPGIDGEAIRAMQPGEVLITAEIPGREAMAIMRRAGLKRGALALRYLPKH